NSAMAPKPTISIVDTGKRQVEADRNSRDRDATVREQSGGGWEWAQDRRMPVHIDYRRLATFNVFSPAHHANRTTEEFRLIKQAVLQRCTRARETGAPFAQVIMVTSTVQGEGKSFVAANLALSVIAESSRPTVLIDADPTRASISAIFGVDRGPGLLDALDQAVPMASTLRDTDVAGLSLVSAGRPRPLGAELFSSDRMRLFLEAALAADKNRLILLDAPPILATTESSALARHVGQIVFVVEAERVNRRSVMEALNLVAICPDIGFVLNKTRFQFGAVQFGAYYKYYYGKGKRRRVSGDR